MKPKNQTEEFLYHVSSHIHSRPKLKNIPITVIIDECHMEIDPKVIAFPDIHHKKQRDAEALLEHVMLRHMKEGCSEKLVSGKYVYTKGWNSKKRSWRRV